MAQATIKHSGYKLELELSFEECKALKAMVQNPAHENETDAEKRVRSAIWKVMEKVGIR